MHLIRKIVTVMCFVTMIGCENIVEVDFPAYSPQLVVHGLFRPGQPWEVYVTRSVGLGASASQLGEAYIPNARVEIFEGERLITVLTHQGLGRYVASGQFPEVGEIYTLHVAAPGFTPVVAADQIPNPLVRLEAVFIDSVVVGLEDQVEAEIQFHLADLDMQPNFYELQIWYDYGAGPRPIAYRTNDPVLQGDSFQEFVRNGTSIIYYEVSRFEDAFFQNQSFSSSLRFDRLEANYYGISVNPISENYFRYQKTLAQIAEDEENPFAEPTPVFTNVMGGLGVFAGVDDRIQQIALLNEINPFRIAGRYHAKAFRRLRSGNFIDILGLGGDIDLVLEADQRVNGRLVLPELSGLTPEDLVLELTGSYTLDGNAIKFNFDQEIFLNVQLWHYQDGRIELTPSFEQDVYILLEENGEG